MPTDPTPQAVTCKCGGNLVRVPGRWWIHQGYGPRCDNAEPAEPSPAPPDERVIEVAPHPQKPWWDHWRPESDYPQDAPKRESSSSTAAKIRELESALTTMREERDQLKSHYSDAKELIQRMMKEEEVLREERDRSDDDATSMGKMLGDARKGLRDMTEERDQAHDALRAIESLCSDEITARFGGHAHKSEDELGRNSRVYALLVVPRNIARAALKPVSDRQPEGETK